MSVEKCEKNSTKMQINVSKLIGFIGFFFYPKTLTQTTCSHTCSNDHLHFAFFEIGQCFFTLRLLAIAMNWSRWMFRFRKEWCQKVGCTFGFHKYHCSAWILFIQNFHQLVTLFKFSHLEDVLNHIRTCSTNHTTKQSKLYRNFSFSTDTQGKKEFDWTYIVKKMYSCKYLPAKRWISFGNVAENMSVWRLPVGIIDGTFMISSTAGANPMSNMRSASSNTKYFKLSKVTYALSQKSLRRPGVATNIWQPSCENRNKREIFWIHARILMSFGSNWLSWKLNSRWLLCKLNLHWKFGFDDEPQFHHKSGNIWWCYLWRIFVLRCKSVRMFMCVWCVCVRERESKGWMKTNSWNFYSTIESNQQNWMCERSIFLPECTIRGSVWWSQHMDVQHLEEHYRSYYWKTKKMEISSHFEVTYTTIEFMKTLTVYESLEAKRRPFYRFQFVHKPWDHGQRWWSAYHVVEWVLVFCSWIFQYFPKGNHLSQPLWMFCMVLVHYCARCPWNWPEYRWILKNWFHLRCQHWTTHQLQLQSECKILCWSDCWIYHRRHRQHLPALPLNIWSTHCVMHNC